MTEIKIKRLSLENFKCHKSLNLCFESIAPDGRIYNATIYGDNASGKTSIYDALTWLLFGKDSQGNGEKNIEIKPLDTNGEVKDHDALTAVEAVLDVSGEDVTLRRTYKEVWTTKRGSSQATYDGNTSEYYIDGVPCKRNAFQDKVNELVSEDTFRLLTSVSHFANGISWQDRRAVLFKVAGVMDDAQILATNEAFAPLVDSMGRLSIEDYKKKLLAEKKGFVGSKTEIPARISECEKTIADIEGMDFAAARAEVEALNARKESLSAQVLAIEHDSAMDAKRMEIREAQLELSALENENNAYRASQDTGSSNVHSLKTRLTSLQSKLCGKKLLNENERAYIADLDNRITEYRNRWISLNGETFTGGSCPTCGQNLPAAQLQAAKEQFEENKQKRLDDILQTANSYKEAKAQAENRLARIGEEIAQLEAEITELAGQITAAEANVVEIKDMEGYADRKAAINARINALSGELADMASNSSAVKGRLREEIAAVQRDINAKQAIINMESLLDYSRQRVKQLREDAKNAAECLEAIEKMLYLMEEYSRYKTRFVEDSINGLFRIARFRLFREQANGGIEDRCDVVHEGVPYISVNNGMKINLGIDIINTLSTAYGVRVPLFVDNAESVTNLEKCGSQIIRLVVSENDKELRVNYEN
jgi:DNA repair exonuclease SbcCD ATPase subunit